MRDGAKRWWEFDVDLPSGRFISNDILAAVGRVQLRKLPGFLERRRSAWDFYQRELAGLPWLRTPPEPQAGCTSSYYIYWIRVDSGRDELAASLAEQGIYSTFRYFPLHLVPHYRASSRLPNAERLNETALNLPLHQNLSDGDLEHIVACVRKFRPAR